MNETATQTCQRCGRCCFRVGRTFWKNGDYKDIPDLDERANNGDHEDGGLPCEMLRYENDKATCLIQKKYGIEAKPPVCRTYPKDGEPCFREKGEDGDKT